LNVKRSWKIIVVLAVILMAGVAWWLSMPKEPEYQGKKLSQWMQECPEVKVINADPSVSNQREFKLEMLTFNPTALIAVEIIGTNAIPSLKPPLLTHDSGLRDRIYAEIQRVPWFFDKPGFAVGVLGPFTGCRFICPVPCPVGIVAQS
jgi:hypothetical protein